MTRRSVFRAADAVSRRTVLSTATTVCVGAVAGCLDDAEGDAESESGDGDHDRDHDHEGAAGDDVSDASYALASEMIDAIDDEGNLDFMVFLETEWAGAYLDGERSEEAYYAAIVDSEH